MKIRYILIALLYLFFLGCTSKSDTIRTLTAAGYSDIQVKGWDVFGCSEDDFFATEFVATNPIGRETRGTVCCGLIMKSCTIRH